MGCPGSPAAGSVLRTRDWIAFLKISKFKILIDAMKSAYNANFVGTDESILLYKTSNEIKIVDGSSLNFKVTTQSDLDLFKIISDIEIL